MTTSLGLPWRVLKPFLTGGWSAAWRGGVDLVFPPHSLDTTPTGGAPQVQGLSADAWTRIRFLEDPVCDGCGAPFEYDTGYPCAACSARPRAFARARAACIYDEASRDLILQFKHADRTDLARLFAAWIGRAGAPLLSDADAIMPVPLHPGRLFSRRYNQAAEIARPLGRRFGLLYLPDTLQRLRATGGQGGKSGAGRRRNVAGAFAVRPGGAALIEGKRILLIDDVMTTGATAEACARVLLKAGASAVDVAVVARVQEAANLTT
jgi:ComF family protein